MQTIKNMPEYKSRHQLEIPAAQKKTVWSWLETPGFSELGAKECLAFCSLVKFLLHLHRDIADSGSDRSVGSYRREVWDSIALMLGPSRTVDECFGSDYYVFYDKMPTVSIGVRNNFELDCIKMENLTSVKICT
jgi:hypothetical protein